MGNILNDGKKLELEQNYIFWPALIFSACYIVLFIWLGFYQWPQADDWLFIRNVKTQGMGLFKFLSFNYMNWSARIVQFIFIWFLLQMPLNFYGVYVLFTFLFYIAAAYFLVNTLCNDFKFKIKVLLTLIITAVTIATMEAMNETIYWLAAMHYIWSGAFLILAFALALKALNGSIAAFVSCLIILFIDGIMLEQPVIFQGVAAFLAALYFLWKGERRKALICGSFWLVSIAGFLVIYLAPATANRIKADRTFVNNFNLPTAVFVLRMLRVTFLHGSVTAIKFFIKPVIYVFILFVPCIAERINFKLKLRAWHIVVCVIITAFFNQAISTFSVGYHLPRRAESFALWTMLAIWFCMFGFYWRNEKVLSHIKSLKIFQLRWLALIVCLIISPNFVNVISDLKIAPKYWAAYAERVEIVRGNKQNLNENFAVPFIANRPRLLFLADTAYSGICGNDAYANYLGVNNIVPVPRNAYQNGNDMQKWLNGDISVLNINEEMDAAIIYDIGSMYDSQVAGTNVKKDNAKAIELYQRSSSMGYNQANKSLVRVYFTNPQYKNYSKAAYYVARYIIGSIFPFAI